MDTYTDTHTDGHTDTHIQTQTHTLWMPVTHTDGHRHTRTHCECLSGVRHCFRAFTWINSLLTRIL